MQACANDPVVAFHAVRNLARAGFGRAALRWTQLGFGRTSATASGQSTPRNLQGFKDGTNNLHGDDQAAMDQFVWVGDEEPQQWMHGGSYLVSRRIRMLIEVWDRSTLDDQQQTIGRYKASGAPLTGNLEHDAPDLSARDSAGAPVIARDAHIRLAGPGANAGQRILRRGYSYTDGIDPVTGELDAGLFFVAYQRDLENGIHRDPTQPLPRRCTQRVHRPHGERGLRGAAGCERGRLRRRGSLRVGDPYLHRENPPKTRR